MAGKSVICSLINESKRHNLWLSEQHLEEGSYDAQPQKLPDPNEPRFPGRVPLEDRASWRCEATDPFTGVRGRAVFGVGDTGKELRVSWELPIAGSNKFAVECNAPDCETVAPLGTDADQHNATRPESCDDTNIAKAAHVEVRFVVRDRAEQSAQQPQDEHHASSDDGVHAVSAEGSKQTTVKPPDVVARKIIYLGINSGAMLESNSLDLAAMKRPTRHKPTGKKEMAFITAIRAGDNDEFGRKHRLDGSAEDFSERLDIPTDKRGPLVEMERQGNPVDTTGATIQKRVLRADPSRRRIIGALAEALARVEAELAADDFDPEDGPMKRLVISGHHWPSLTANALDVFWGDNQPEQNIGYYAFDRVFTLFGDLFELARIFDKAAAQLEDLHLSGCASGVHDTTDESWCGLDQGASRSWHLLKNPGWLTAFPNLKTVWACEGHSEDCSAQLLEWAKASMRAEPAKDLIATAEEFRKKRGRSRLRQGGRDWVYTIVWTRGANGLEPNKGVYDG